MDNKNFAEITIKDFRAIKSADIKLNGITVVAGINGSGKSTLSKFLYNCFYYANHYEDLVLEFHKNEFNTCNDLMKQLALHIGESSYLSMLDDALENLAFDRYMNVVQKIQIAFVKLSKINSDNLKLEKLSRLLRIFENGLGQSLSVDDMVDKCIEKLEYIINKTKTMLITRQDKFFNYKLSVIYPDFDKEKLDFREFGISYINADTMPMPFSVKDIFYIDSPVMQSKSDYWNHLYRSLSEINHNQYPEVKQLFDFISGPEVMNGLSYFDYNSQTFKFKSPDGDFNLQECATGIQAFAIIQMLLKNGRLSNSTLLVIDEPEVHLHPQWIIEYARLIVLLHKQLGVKFFIASHNPDLVSAVKYISEKEEILDSVDYYFAQKDSDGRKYNFTHCGNDIEPIFNSFNMSYDKLRNYVN